MALYQSSSICYHFPQLFRFSRLLKTPANPNFSHQALFALAGTGQYTFERANHDLATITSLVKISSDSNETGNINAAVSEDNVPNIELARLALTHAHSTTQTAAPVAGGQGHIPPVFFRVSLRIVTKFTLEHKLTYPLF